jgi:hypothetical protein
VGKETEMVIQFGTSADNLDYAVLQKETLNQLKGALLAEQTRNEYLINLVDTAIDYSFYLTDERIK